MSGKNVQYKHHGNLPSVDGDGPSKIPRKFASKDMLDAATAALRRRGVKTHPWNGRLPKRP